MSEVEIKKANPRDNKYKAKGLQDLGHTILRCSNCDKESVDIWLIKKFFTEEEIKKHTFKYSATCPYCEDHSFEKEIVGRVVFGGISKPNPENPTDDLQSYTIIDKIETLDPDKCIFHVKKAK